MTEDHKPEASSQEVKPPDPAAASTEPGPQSGVQPARAKKKMRAWKILLFVVVGLVILRALIFIPVNTPRGPEDSYRLINVNPAPAVVYNGPGELDAYLETEIPLGNAVRKFPRFKSEVLGHDRDVLVYKPAGYKDLAAPLPLMIVFHGYLDRPQHLLMAFVKAFDSAVSAGRLPPSVLVFPDVSIGGTGEDDPATPNLDERMGSWCVNSNLGRYEDYLVKELIPWVRKTYHVTADARYTALAGFSAGGFCALGLTLKHPGLAMTTLGFSATIDARYSVNGSRTAPFDRKGYKPIAKDDPNRPVMRAGLLGTFTDRWAFYPVFDSDKTPGPTWTRDLSVWQRVREENPMDLVRKGDLDLTGHMFFIVAGDRDQYGFQNHIPLFSEELHKRGATTAPPDPVRHGVHTVQFVEEQLPDASIWLGTRLRFEGESPQPAATAPTSESQTPVPVSPGPAIKPSVLPDKS